MSCSMTQHRVSGESCALKSSTLQPSGLDKDLDQWVFHPLLFNSMSILLPTKISNCRSISSVAKTCEKTHFI